MDIRGKNKSDTKGGCFFFAKKLMCFRGLTQPAIFSRALPVGSHATRHKVVIGIISKNAVQVLEDFVFNHKYFLNKFIRHSHLHPIYITAVTHPITNFIITIWIVRKFPSKNPYSMYCGAHYNIHILHYSPLLLFCVFIFVLLLFNSIHVIVVNVRCSIVDVVRIRNNKLILLSKFVA